MLLNILLTLSFMMVMTSSQNSSYELTLTVNNISNSNGVIRVLLFQGPEGFPDQPNLAKQNASLKIINNTASHTFKNLSEGTYAISLFHDSQNTGKLRTNIFGIPKDGYGFSNNAAGIVGAPSFEKAAFKLTKDVKHINIKLR